MVVYILDRRVTRYGGMADVSCFVFSRLAEAPQCARNVSFGLIFGFGNFTRVAEAGLFTSPARGLARAGGSLIPRIIWRTQGVYDGCHWSVIEITTRCDGRWAVAVRMAPWYCHVWTVQSLWSRLNYFCAIATPTLLRSWKSDALGLLCKPLSLPYRTY